MRDRTRLTASVSGIMIMLLLMMPIVHSSDLAPPREAVLLVITGDMSHTNVGDEVHLDLPALESLPATQFITSTPWHDTAQSFTGVRLSDLLEAIGSSSAEIVAIGLDDYQFTIRDLDLDKYPVIIAYRQNGDAISVRKLGPLRIMMPFDDYPELRTPLNESRAVWQLVKLELN